MEVIVKINTLVGSGPFKITWGGYLQGEIHVIQPTQNSTPLAENIPRWQLLNGFTFNIQDGIRKIRVSEMGPCPNYVDIDILSEEVPPDEPPGNIGDTGTPITELTPTENIKIVGSSIPTTVAAGFYTMVRYDVWKYTITGPFVTGAAQFDIEGYGILGETEGGPSFPTGTLTGNQDPAIPVQAGNYKVTLDISTGVYLFV